MLRRVCLCKNKFLLLILLQCNVVNVLRNWTWIHDIPRKITVISNVKEVIKSEIVSQKSLQIIGNGIIGNNTANGTTHVIKQFLEACDFSWIITKRDGPLQFCTPRTFDLPATWIIYLKYTCVIASCNGITYTIV